ncbi:MAG: B12-binding domain-containing radical SAM protein [Planctomycetota bacterium]|jgi:radical SAM superfamily enzyme YgiQ (UPF0313 family)
MMNVALVHVDWDLEAFGVRCLSSFLKAAGHQTTLLLMRSKDGSYSPHVLDRVRELTADCDVVGLSCFSRASQKAIQIIDYVRPLGKITIWGGIHATLNPEECAKHADVVCRGEGEGFMLELVEKLKGGGNWKDIANAAYRENGRVVVNDVRSLIGDLDELPIIDFSHENEFQLKHDRFIKVDSLFDAAYPISFNGTRGCAFHCTYCSNSKVKELASGKGRYVRKLSISKLIEHAENLKERFPQASCINFFDEDFCARPLKDIKQFSDEYSKRIGLPFECMVSPLQVNEEKIQLLVKAGLWRINMGVESGSERTKKEIYNRHMSNEAVLRAAGIINRYSHVVPYYFFIIANPYETTDDLLATLSLLQELPHPYFLRIYNLVFFPGTLLYESAVTHGIIGGSSDSGFELDFLAGLNFKKHPWKRKNLYLNGLIYLMAGNVKRHRLGLIPRGSLGFLLRPKVVAFNERHTVFIRSFIAFKIFTWKLRSFAAYMLKKILRDPIAIYRVGKRNT